MSGTGSLFTAIRAGDRNAFEELVGRESRRLLGIAYRITKDSALAEDVVQGAFLKLLEGRARLRDDAAGSAWLARVAARLALDALRKKASFRRREEERALEHARRQGTPGDALMESEEARLVGEALDALSAETRAAIWLHVVEGNTVREVAVALETPRSTVNRRIQTGLKHLQNHLRRAGFLLPLGASLGELLARLPVPQPSPGLLARMEMLIDGVGAPAAGAEGTGTEAPFGRWRKRALPAAGGAVLLAAVGAALWIVLESGRSLEDAQPVAGMGPARPAPSKEAPTPAPELKEVAPAKVVLAGKVVDELGSPRGGADVLAYDDFTLLPLDAVLLEWKFLDLLEKALDAPEPLARTRSRDDGMFEIELEAGAKVKLLALSPFEGGIDSGSVRASARRPADGDTAEGAVEIIMLPASAISGSVTAEDGSPIEGARVIVLPWPRTLQGRDLTTDDIEDVLRMYVPRHDVTKADGAFSIPALPTPERHHLKIFARSSGHATVQADVGTVLPTDPVHIVLPPATSMPGKAAFMPEGRPAAGARVVAFREPFGDGAWFSFATADASGGFVLEGSAETGIKVLAKTAGHMFPRRVFIDPGELELPLFLDITSGTAIRGTVRYADSGKPAAGLDLLCRDMAGPHISVSARTENDGTYRIEGISWSARCQVIPDAPGLMRKDLTPQWPSQKVPEVTLDIDLIPTMTLRGRVVGATGAPIADGTVEAVTVVDSTWDALALRWAREMRGKGPVRSGDDGTFVLEEVPPQGKLFLWAYHPEHGESLLAQDMGAGARDGIVIALEGGAGLRVRCTDLRGDPLDRMVVMVDALAVPEFIPVGSGKVAFYYQRTSLDMTFVERSEGNAPCQRHAMTHAEGTVAWNDMLPGTQRVSIMEFKEGLGTEEEGYWIFTGKTAAELEPGKVTELSIAIDSSHVFAGRVVDRGGSGVPSLLVHALSARKEHAGLEDVLHHAVGPTDDEGRFRLEGLGPGPYRIKVTPVARDARGFRQDLHDARDVPGGEGVIIVLEEPAPKPR